MSEKKLRQRKLREPINYLRKAKDIPSFDVPSYGGQRYEATVPDTLDIQERIALVVHGLTEPTDHEKDHLMYFTVNFRSNPPSMCHNGSDVCQVKSMEALPLVRIASGINLNDHIDPVWMRFALRQIGPDGLFYWPTSYFPWEESPPAWSAPCPPGNHCALPFINGRAIAAMTVYLLRDPSGPWEKKIHKTIGGLQSIAIEKDDYAYFPQGGFLPNKPRIKKAAMPIGISSSLVGWTIMGLAQYHRVSGYEPAIALANKLSRYLVHHGLYYGANGEFLPNYVSKDNLEIETKDGQRFVPGAPPVSNRIHFVHHTRPLLGLLDHALAVGDDDLCEFVHKAYKWARAKGNTVIGFFPENIDNVNELETSETCCEADMISLALKLTAAGVGDYWDDADRWIRNRFAENQLLHSEWIYQMSAGGLMVTRTNIPPSVINPISETCDRVPERNIGAFAGWSTVNDWFVGHGSGIMHCCAPNAARTLYYIWEHMLVHDRGTLSVNLLLNRPSQWADVHSHIPYQGQVDISVKKPCKLKVRIPEWTKPGEVRCRVNGRSHSLRWNGRYAVVGKVHAKDMVSVTFPIAERSVEVDIEKQRYFLIVRGNEVVDIYPRGRFCPLYQRNHYRQGIVRWKKVERFVSDEMLYW